MIETGFDIKDGVHPIVPVMLYDAKLSQVMAEKLLAEGKIGLIYVEISGTKKGFDLKVEKIVKLLNKYNFELKKTWNYPHFSFLSNLKATDNLFIKNN